MTFRIKLQFFLLRLINNPRLFMFFWFVNLPQTNKKAEKGHKQKVFLYLSSEKIGRVVVHYRKVPTEQIGENF